MCVVFVWEEILITEPEVRQGKRNRSRHRPRDTSVIWHTVHLSVCLSVTCLTVSVYCSHQYRKQGAPLWHFSAPVSRYLVCVLPWPPPSLLLSLLISPSLQRVPLLLSCLTHRHSSAHQRKSSVCLHTALSYPIGLLCSPRLSLFSSYLSGPFECYRKPNGVMHQHLRRVVMNLLWTFDLLPISE